MGTDVKVESKSPPTARIMGTGIVVNRRMRPDGRIDRLVCADVILDPDSDIYWLSKWNAQTQKKERFPALAATAFYKANKVAAITIVTPPFLEIGPGDFKPNPYLHYEGMVPKGVWVKKGATGFAPSGGLVTIWTVVHLDLRQYFLEDLIGKMPDNKKEIYYCSERAITPETFMDYIVLEADFGLRVCAKLTNPEVQKCLKTHNQRQKFAERIAVTICERNALAKHPAIAARKPIEIDGKFILPVTGWLQDDSDQADLAEAVQESERGRDADNVQTINEKIEATINDVAGAQQESIEGDPQTTNVEETDPVAEDQNRQVGMDALRALWRKDRKRFDEELEKKFPGKTIPDLTTAQISAMVDTLQEEGGKP